MTALDYGTAAFIVPVVALVIAGAFEFAMPALRKPAIDAILRMAWDGAVTALGLTGAIGSEFAVYRGNDPVVPHIGLNPYIAQTLGLMWVFICMAFILGLRVGTKRWYAGVFAVLASALALSVPGAQAFLIATSGLLK